VKPKRSLGQNFLKSPQIAEDIVKAGSVRMGESVVEVGAGRGILTQALLKVGAVVIAIEKDDALFANLKRKFSGEEKSGKLKLIHADIFDVKFDKSSLFGEKYKIVANLPYNITGKFFPFIFSQTNLPSSITILLQREVSERIVAHDKKESLLSISIKVYGEPKILMEIKSLHFTPKPKVDSSLISITNISKNFFADISPAEFFRILKMGFAHKRKVLKNNLSIKDDLLKRCGVSKMARAEELTKGDWKCLALEL